MIFTNFTSKTYKMKEKFIIVLTRGPIKNGLALKHTHTTVHFLLQPRPKTVFYPKLNNILACREITANEGDRINKANFTGTISTIKTLNRISSGLPYSSFCCCCSSLARSRLHGPILGLHQEQSFHP